MSLINEALKRAEKDRGRSGDGGRGRSDGNANRPDRPPRQGRQAVLILSAFVLAAVAIVMYVSLPPENRPQVPAAGHAAAPDPADTTREVEVIAVEQTRIPEPTKVAAEHFASVRETLAAMNDYKPTPAAAPAPAPVAAPPAAPVVPAPAPAPAPVVAPPPVASPAVEPAPLDPADFQLGAILRSGEDSHVLINNQLVGVGDQIDGAKVVEIGKYHVTIEKDGKRLTLRM